MDSFRVYRLPGSREFWLVDSGPDTSVIQARGIDIKCGAMSRANEDATPRAWLEVAAREMYVVDEIAVFPGAA